MSELQSSFHRLSPEEKAKQFIGKYSVVADFDNATNYQKMIAIYHANAAVDDIISVLLTQDVFSSSIEPVYKYYCEVRDILWGYHKEYI